MPGVGEDGEEVISDPLIGGWRLEFGMSLLELLLLSLINCCAIYHARVSISVDRHIYLHVTSPDIN